MTARPLAPGELWTWAVETYDRPGVKDAFLALQNAHGVDVVVVLWRLWLHAQGRTVDPATEASALALSAAWRASAIAPLRAVRDALKTPTAAIEPGGAATLRRAVLDAELTAERLALEALERLSQHALSAPGAAAQLVDVLAQIPELSDLPHAALSPLVAALDSR
jgi:uncharacterized protein (TIGR02444 family)